MPHYIHDLIPLHSKTKLHIAVPYITKYTPNTFFTISMQITSRFTSVSNQGLLGCSQLKMTVFSG